MLLREVLGYAEETSLALVRTHIGNLRHKCRVAGLARSYAPTRAAVTRRLGSLLSNMGAEPSR